MTHLGGGYDQLPDAMLTQTNTATYRHKELILESAGTRCSRQRQSQSVGDDRGRDCARTLGYSLDPDAMCGDREEGGSTAKRLTT